jgi:hypothetical protein
MGAAAEGGLDSPLGLWRRLSRHRGAHESAPKERAGLGNENLAIHWAKRLAIAGRSKVIRLIVTTQRIQSHHDAVLESCEALVAHRLMMAADRGPEACHQPAEERQPRHGRCRGGFACSATGWDRLGVLGRGTDL